MRKVPSLAVMAARVEPTTDTCTLPKGSPPSALVTFPVRSMAWAARVESNRNKRPRVRKVRRVASGKSPSPDSGFAASRVGCVRTKERCPGEFLQGYRGNGRLTRRAERTSARIGTPLSDWIQYGNARMYLLQVYGC